MATPTASSSRPSTAASSATGSGSCSGTKTGQHIDPRVLRTREAVLAAAVDLLATDGIGRLTIDAIAQRSGVARSTIYRNWPDRAELLLAAFESVALLDCPLATLGCHGDHVVGEVCTARPAETVDDLRAVIEEHAHRLIRVKGSTLGAALGSIVAESKHDPAIAEALHRFGQARRRPLITVARRVVTASGVTPRTNLAVAVERFVAPFFYRFLVSGEPIGPKLVDRQTELLLSDLGFD